MPYIILRLGKQGYGIYQLARSALVFFMFLQMGMGPTLIRFFAKAIARNDVEELQRINSTAQALLGGLGLLATLLGLALIPVFIHFYEIPADLLNGTIGLLICMAISLFLNMTLIVPQGLVFGVNRYDLANWVEVSYYCCLLLLTIALFELIHPSVFFVGLATLIAQSLRFTALFSVALKYTGKAVFFHLRKVNRTSMRSVLGFSMLNLTNSIAATVFFQTPVLIIGKVLGGEMVTAFAPALLISNAMQGFLAQTTRPLVPLASQNRAQNQGDALGQWAISAGKLAAFVGFGIALPFAAFGPELIGLWLGNDLVWIWPVVAVMATAVAISQVQAANYFLALGGGHIKPTVYSQIAMAVIGFIGILFGTTQLGWGILGVAVFMATSIFIRNTFYLAYAYSRQFSYTYIRYLWAVYGMPAIITAFCIASGWALKSKLSTTNLFFLAVEIIIVIGAYVLINWFFLLPRQMKSRVVAWGSAKIMPSRSATGSSSGADNEYFK